MCISPEALKDLHALVASWTEEHVHVQSLEEAEQVSEDVRRACGEAVLEQAVLQTAGKKSYRGCRLACSCGEELRFVSYRRRWVKALCGEVEVRRAYYHCGKCGTGCVPWDRESGLSSLVWTPRVKALIAQMAGRLSYRESVELLTQTGILRIEESCVERIVAEVAQRMRAVEEARIASVERADASLAGPEVVRGRRLYTSLDAAKGHIDGEWHDIKVGTVYTAEPGPDGSDVMKERVYVAAQEHAERFGWRLYAQACALGEPHYPETVVIGDGADFIWKIAEFHFPRATHVLDFMHASEHIWTLSRALYGEGSSQGRRWAQDRIRSLNKEGPGPLLRSLRRRKAPNPEAAEVLRREAAYFANNRHRMQYHRFTDRGIMIGSGPVEAACKVVVGQRMKQSGMRWCARGADAILAVRTAVLNRDYANIYRSAMAS